MDLFSNKWQKGTEKSRSLFGRVKEIFRSPGLDENTLEDLEELLIESDLGVETAMEIVDHLRGLHLDSSSADSAVKERLKSELLGQLTDASAPKIEMEKHHPHVVLVVGVNGTGKTTTIGKLARRYRSEGKKVLLAAADTFRAAACEQLVEWGKRTDSEVVVQSTGADPASVAYDALDSALAKKMDVVLVDTAGRLHSKVNLMEELKKIKRVLQKRMPDAPHEVLLVLDATVGQNGLTQAKSFSEAVGVTGVALTKLDGTAKGGIVIAIHKTLNLPVLWAGLGEGAEDLVPFDAEAFIKGLLDIQ